ncbi:hypothetical protein RFI_25885 [Reticulomyxa filosa]|uniref:Uncharacterized protein n=1 Tax=Reticulomyxa filosa TaxID=46433 RepID=X6MDJ6_RETFI|nr:hypothetical protein RFI_25885 [Reticulomyxa filosa]|eukprot:ETO11492.1 hypothetical protein RFI_25885 [Reticulomyxa filosa]
MKLEEEQLDNVFQCLINGLFDEKEEEYNRKNCAQLLGKLSMKWNKQQLNTAFNSLSITLNKGYYWTYKEALETITMKFSGKQFVNVFNYLISVFNDKYANLLEEISQRLDEKQINIALNYFMNKLNDRYKRHNICIKCTQILKIISNKCNEQQLNEAFNFSMDIFTDKNNNAEVRGGYAELIGTIAVNLSGRHFDDAFKCLINGLKDSVRVFGNYV